MMVSDVRELLIIVLTYFLCLKQGYMAVHQGISKQRELRLNQVMECINILILLVIDFFIRNNLHGQLIFLLYNKCTLGLYVFFLKLCDFFELLDLFDLFVELFFDFAFSFE